MTDHKDLTPPEPAVDERLALLERQAQEHLDGWKRAKADYLNLKKQAEKEKEEIAKFAQAGAVLQFLPIYDNLKRAQQHIPEDEQSKDWVKGIRHIQKQFEDVMRSMGIVPIATVGQPFDPNLHHAVERVKRDDLASGTIICETKTGFMLGERVLEPAQVTVAE